MQKRGTIFQRVMQCAFYVSNLLGAGFLESVYEKALCIELSKKDIEFKRQEPIDVVYKGQVVGKYVTELLFEDRRIVELKALSELSAKHEAQVMNYLRATGKSVGLLLNFGTSRLGIRRIAWQYNEIEGI